MKAHSLSKRQALEREGRGLSPYKTMQQRGSGLGGGEGAGMGGNRSTMTTPTPNPPGPHTLVRALNCCLVAKKEVPVPVLRSWFFSSLSGSPPPQMSNEELHQYPVPTQSRGLLFFRRYMGLGSVGLSLRTRAPCTL